MGNGRARAATATGLVLVAALAGPRAGGATREGTVTMESEAGRADRPAMDLAVPARTERAVFALG